MRWAMWLFFSNARCQRAAGRILHFDCNKIAAAPQRHHGTWRVHGELVVRWQRRRGRSSWVSSRGRMKRSGMGTWRPPCKPPTCKGDGKITHKPAYAPRRRGVGNFFFTVLGAPGLWEF